MQGFFIYPYSLNNYAIIHPLTQSLLPFKPNSFGNSFSLLFLCLRFNKFISTSFNSVNEILSAPADKVDYF